MYRIFIQEHERYRELVSIPTITIMTTNACKPNYESVNQRRKPALAAGDPCPTAKTPQTLDRLHIIPSSKLRTETEAKHSRP